MQSVIESTIITMKAAGLWRPKRRGFVTVNMESMPADAVRVQPRPDGSVRLYARKFTPSSALYRVRKKADTRSA